RRRVSLALRILLITLLVLAVAGLGVARAADRLSVVFLVDRSDSVSATARAAQADYVQSAIADMKEGDSAGVVAFGADALVDRPPTTDKTPPDLASKPGPAYTNIADAIRLGLSILPSDSARRMVLLSDGKENLGSAEWAARLAGANGVPLDIISLSSLSGPEVWLDGLSAPASVREGEHVSLEVSVSASLDTTATLTILMDGAPITTQAVDLVSGSNKFVQQLPPAVRGFHTYSASVDAPVGADTRRENNHYSAFSLVLGKPRVLLVEGHDGEASALQAALAPGVEANVVPPSAMPTDLSALAGYDGIILVNVPASSLAQTTMSNLQIVVRDLGKGLVVVGGDESYAAGGYFRTPLEAMLPVDLHLPSKLNIPSVGMVLVIDRSGSMEMAHSGTVGVKKIELAKEAASLAVSQLSDRDYAGVITFDSGADWVVPLQALGDPADFKSKIGSISSGGGTNIYAGLAPAVDALVASKAKSKHIVLLTDGDSEGGDYDGLIKKMSDNEITLSTVAVGIDANTNLMQYLAQQGKGNYYYTEDGNALPQIFAHESHIASRSYLIEHPFEPARTSASPILEGIGGLPELQGYVGTSPRAGGQVALVSDAGDPVLAQWQYGLGRVVAWTSDAKGQWASQWVGWSDFARFWSQALRWATATEAGGALQPQVSLEGGVAHITVDATSPDGQYLNNLQSSAVVVAPDNITSTVALRQTAAGRYEGSLPATQEGAYLVRVGATGGDKVSLSRTIGVVVPYSPEYRGDATDNGLMARLANLTSGRTLAPDDPAAPFVHNLPGVRSTTPLWPLLLLLAILLLPFDIGLRRVSVSRGDIREWLGQARQKLGLAPRRPALAGGPASPEIAAMMRARSRVRDRRPVEAPVLREASEEPSAWARDLPRREPAIPKPPELGAIPAPPATSEKTTESAETDDESLAARLRRARERR
ncbi:MAG TPA: VWA domain-containing protein, partial [Chloroflexia bacterium]|nr:VWA domain-containing protein [Chloroflexia bacterium]